MSLANLESFDAVYQRAAERKGGADKLDILLSESSLQPNKRLAELDNSRILSAFTKKVFQSGFVWRVVEQKWPDFEQVFFNFDIEKILMMPDEMWEQKAQDPRIIRNFNKVKTIKANAQMIFEHSSAKQSFAAKIANWPSDDVIGLWGFLKKHGARLGGNTGPYALRTLGKDTFLLSRDVEGYFRAHELISGGAQTKASLTTIQQAFSQWQQQSNWSLAKLSRLVSYASGDNHVQLGSE